MMKDGVHSDAMVSATLTLWDQRCPSSSSCSSITCLVEASTDWNIIRLRHSDTQPPSTGAEHHNNPSRVAA